MAPAFHEPSPPASAQIIDIRDGADFVPLADQIRSGLGVPDGQEKRLPTLLLYDELGLQLFEKITYLDEYYLTNQEIGVLQQYAGHIAERIARKPGSIVLELGSGNLRKVRLLLEALDKKGIPITYYALDLSQQELERTLAEVPPGAFEHVECFGLLGTYDDGLAFLQRPDNLDKPKTILWLGSSIGNLNRRDAADFLTQYKDVLGKDDSFLLSVDACQQPDKVYHAYNDRHGITHAFVLNGLRHANRLLGRQAFELEDWQVIGEYDVAAGRHHAFVTPKRDLKVEGIVVRAGERIRIEESYKYSQAQTRELLQTAGWSEGCRWASEDGDYVMPPAKTELIQLSNLPHLHHTLSRQQMSTWTDNEAAIHLLQDAAVRSPTIPEHYAAGAVPSLQEWHSLWKAWDTVTRDMIPDQELLDKPIKLRNACIFYLGHIPTFLDIHLTRATKGKPTEPSYYTQIFERGIDPDVDDPEKCHAHSEIPDSWPPVKDILTFQEDVRSRVKSLYYGGKAAINLSVGRALWLGFEHEIMHLETLLYMLVQSEKTLPPPGLAAPDFEALSIQAGKRAVPNEWFDIPAQTITVGMDDESDETLHYYGWDNERPAREEAVKAFRAQARPLTNGEYAEYLAHTHGRDIPASWISIDGPQNGHDTSGIINGHSNGATGEARTNGEASKGVIAGRCVRTVYGSVPLKWALDWPVSASYDELAACASYMGGRIPTTEEAWSIYRHAEATKAKKQQALSETIPAVNGHLLADGVAEDPPDKRAANGLAGPTPQDYFIDLSNTNTGFAAWHPVSVTANGNALAGQSEMGGLWEWTSTPLAPHQGFEAMDLYPGYTADFFDGKHNVVLGGSWATLPRIAGRKSFVNWYQRNYPYVWAGARLVKDLQ